MKKVLVLFGLCILLLNSCSEVQETPALQRFQTIAKAVQNRNWSVVYDNHTTTGKQLLDKEIDQLISILSITNNTEAFDVLSPKEKYISYMQLIPNNSSIYDVYGRVTALDTLGDTLQFHTEKAKRKSIILMLKENEQWHIYKERAQ